MIHCGPWGPGGIVLIERAFGSGRSLPSSRRFKAAEEQYGEEVTTGTSYSSGLGTTVQVGNSNYTGDTADFIIERGLHNNTLSPLSNFYYLNYLEAWVNGNGSGNGVGHYSNQNINMYNFSKGYLLANTSGLSNNTTFTIYYDNCQ